MLLRRESVNRFRDGEVKSQCIEGSAKLHGFSESIIELVESISRDERDSP